MHYGDYELSMMRIYEGTRTGGLSGKRWRQLYCATEFTREEINKIDVVDNLNKFGFQPPVGEGWNMRKISSSAGKPSHIWTRKPFNGAYSEAWELGPEVTSKNDTNFTYYKYRETRLKYATPESTEFKFDISITLRSFINYIISKSSPELANYELKSTFFFNDFENEISLLNGTTGFNYVTGRKNHLNNLRLFFTKDLPLLQVNENTLATLTKDELSKKYIELLDKTNAITNLYNYLKFLINIYTAETEKIVKKDIISFQ